MAPVRLALALVLLQAASPARAAPEPLAEVSVGGGWESNASGSSGAAKVDAAFALARASVGAAFTRGADDELGVELAYDGSFYPDLPDLDLHRPGVLAGWTRWLGERAAIRVAPFAALRYAGDAARSGWDAGLDGTFRVRATRRLVVRAGLGYVHRSAREAVFTSSTGRARASVELELGRAAWTSLGYALAAGDGTFYAEPIAAGQPRTGPGAAPEGREGRPVGTFGRDLVAYRADLTGHTVSMNLGLRGPGGSFLHGGYGFSAVDGEVQRYESHVIWGELGWRH
jgi:hypothetical protein